MQGQVILLQVLGLLLLDVLEALVQGQVKEFVVEAFVVEVEEVFLSSLSLQPHSQEHGLQRVFGLGALRGPASRLCSLHPAGVVLDPFPETRPLP